MAMSRLLGMGALAFSMRLEGEALIGKHKWLGGAMCGSRIFGVPSHHSCVLSIDVETGEVDLIETNVLGKFKWLRGVACGDAVIGVPSYADQVLKVSREGEVSFFDVPDCGAMTWKWHGGQEVDGKVYAPPANANGVLVADPNTGCRIIPVAEGVKNKFYGGIKSGRLVYGVPYAADRVLRIDTTTGSAESIGPRLGVGFADNWHGGLTCSLTGRVFGLPANADAVIVVEKDTVRLLAVPGARGRYQWGGGIQSSKTGVIYGVPSDALDILRIDLDLSVTRFGNVGPRKNKWQNAVEGPDGSLYCVPCDADYVLRIDPLTDTVEFLGQTELPDTADKWQGAFFAHDAIWAIPENAPAVLKLDFSVSASSPRITLHGASTPGAGARAASHRRAYSSGVPCDKLRPPNLR